VWETLATTQRQDRLLHGAAKLLNLVIGLVALPAWLIAQRLREPFVRLLRRFVPDEPVLLPLPVARARSMEALMADLEAIPQHLRSNPRAELRKGFADLSSFVLAQNRETANLGYAYPRHFQDHVFDGADGVPIGASVALHEEPRPALVVVHGVFTTRRFDYVRQIAVRAYYEWGFNVAAVDLRSFGLTELLSAAPSTGGWKEGEDLIAVAAGLKDLGATSVGAIGISLGGSAVLAACHPEGAEEALDGGILAVSPPADVDKVSRRLAKKLPPRHPQYLLNRLFKAMLLSRTRGSRWAPEIEDLNNAIDLVPTAYYRVSGDEVRKRSSAVNHIAKARVPVLILHPEDDHIIKVDQAYLLAEAARDNQLVRVWVLPAGGHGALDAVDRAWTYSVYRTFFERWAAYPDRDRDELVYSAPPTGKLRTSG
jgi:predicted alpha/beta-fold hydrolase